MSVNYEDLIDRYFDDSLSSEQLAQLNEWIKSDPKNARQFASRAMLHDRLRSELAVADEVAKVVLPSQSQSMTRRRWPFALASTACAVLLAVSLLWQAVDAPSASAAMTELNRIIEASKMSVDRTFVISVLDAVVPPKHQDRRSPERGRPPKPSLEGAVLDVRGPDQFVLGRKTATGEWFITGRNETTSWAIRPDGPVRYSDDLAEFARDLPGHEDGLPINNLSDGLEALRTAYDLELASVSDTESSAKNDGGTIRRMIARKKPGFRGAERIEIVYDDASGQISELRFDQMSYGPQQISLKMTAVEEQAFPENYFDHSHHHGPERVVEFE
ncbi:hypothetical protein Pla100_03600 [Neorhodopirellula pilleata]|uniref:Uncharacterized protein n=1 Tax=Neorhodopirellula pilleata TaxID=2714738 RepID=A0A5C6AWB7_9BACT|nr:hypothetical protein Pla100_03600 [Neorhodopirellula pilleata]